MRWRRELALWRAIADDALAMLRSEWRAQALTLLGIVWGASSVVLLLAFGSGLYRFFDLGFKKTGDRYMVAVGTYTSSEMGGSRPGQPVVLEHEDLERARAALSSARLVGAEFQRAGVVTRTDLRTASEVVSASTPEIRHMKVLKVARGRFHDQDDHTHARPVAVLGHNIAREYFGERDPLGREVRLGGRPLRVVGVLERKGAQIAVQMAIHDDMIWIPLSTGQRIFESRDAVGTLLAEPWQIDENERLKTELRDLLAQRHRLAEDEREGVTVYSTADFRGNLGAMAAALDVLLGGVGTLILAMAAVGVANLMVANVRRRGVELAMRRACGARRRDLVLQLGIETGMVVGAGGLAGVVGATALVVGVGALPLPDLVPPPTISGTALLTTCAVLVAIGALAGVVPGRRAAEVDPASALRAR